MVLALVLTLAAAVPTRAWGEVTLDETVMGQAEAVDAGASVGTLSNTRQNVIIVYWPNSLQDAINRFSDNPPADGVENVIRLGADITIGERLELSGRFTLDLDGHTLTRAGADGSDTGQVLYVPKDAQVTITDLNAQGSITGGNAQMGGGIYNCGELLLTGVAVRGNKAAQGGGIYNEGTLTTNGCEVVENEAYVTGSWKSSRGGGIYNIGRLAGAGGQVSNNKCTGGNGADRTKSLGGGICNEAYVHLETCRVVGNSAQYGGGLYWRMGQGMSWQPPQGLSISGCTIMRNTAGSEGGGVCIDAPYGNVALGDASRLTSVQYNTAARGGGLSVWGSCEVVITNASVMNNTATTAMDNAAGVYCVLGVKLNVTGSVAVAGNTIGGEERNLYMDGNRPLQVSGELTGDEATLIGLHAPGTTLPTPSLTSGYAAHNADDPSLHFFSDDDRLEVYLNKDGEVALRASGGDHEHQAGTASIENVVEATCEEPGSHDVVVRCTICGAELSCESMQDDALDHDWAEPTYAWSDDLGTVTATRVCSRDDDHMEQEVARTTAVRSSNGSGVVRYVATFSNPAFAPQAKELSAQDASHTGKAGSASTAGSGGGGSAARAVLPATGDYGAPLAKIALALGGALFLMASSLLGHAHRRSSGT